MSIVDSAPFHLRLLHLIEQQADLFLHRRVLLMKLLGCSHQISADARHLFALLLRRRSALDSGQTIVSLLVEGREHLFHLSIKRGDRERA